MSERPTLDYGTTTRRRTRWVVLGLILIVPLLAAILAATLVRPAVQLKTVPAQQKKVVQSGGY